MKLTFSILCGLLLALTPAARLPAAPASASAACQCHCGGRMPCCAARPAPHSQPAPLAAPNAGAQNFVLLPARTLIGGPFSTDEMFRPPAVFAPLQALGSAPLYQRNCALLI